MVLDVELEREQDIEELRKIARAQQRLRRRRPRRTRFKGQRRTQLAATLVAATYNLLRISRLLPAAA